LFHHLFKRLYETLDMLNSFTVSRRLHHDPIRSIAHQRSRLPLRRSRQESIACSRRIDRDHI
jgi:hypothetical protein